MKLLITGGCGFVGSNLASRALDRGDELTLIDNLSRVGSDKNLEWLKTRGKFNFRRVDIRVSADVRDVVRYIKPDAVFHLAGQVAMTTSIADPRLDFEINTLGTINVLEAIRTESPSASVLYSSTNKVYGDLEQFTYRERESRFECIERPSGFDESTPLDFQSPYGCSKGAADQYILDYARIYGLNTAVFRHSSMYGGRQFATYDQGWIGWFCAKILDAKRGMSTELITISGTGKQVRDALHAEDVVRLYFAAADRIQDARGQVFNIGGGINNSLSLLELFAHLSRIVGHDMSFKRLQPRASDQRFFVADYSKATRLLNWEPLVDVRQGLADAVRWAQAATQTVR